MSKKRSMTFPSGVVDTFTLLIVSSSSHNTSVTSAILKAKSKMKPHNEMLRIKQINLTSMHLSFSHIKEERGAKKGQKITWHQGLKSRYILVYCSAYVQMYWHNASGTNHIDTVNTNTYSLYRVWF